MRPLRNNIIIRVEIDQKESITYGTLKLLVPRRSRLNTDGKIGNPVLAEVIAINEQTTVAVGDKVILAHTTIENTAWILSVEDNVALLSIPCDKWVLGKLDENGELLPLHGNVTAKRIGETPPSSIIIVPDAFKKVEKNKVTIDRVPVDEPGVELGDTAIVFLYSDYEIFWVWNGQDKSAIVVKREDILATL